MAAAPNQIDPSYPWEGYYHSGAAPEGGDAAVKKVVRQGLQAIAPILEAGAAVYGVGIEQISPTYSPGDPNLEDSERAYAAKFQPNLAEASPSVAAIRGTVPRRVNIAKTPAAQAAAKAKTKALAAGAATVQGLGAGTSDLVQGAAKDAAIGAVKQGAAQTIVSQFTSADPTGAAQLAVTATNIVLDPKAALSSPSARLNTAASLASAAVVAAGAPVIGWAIGAGMAIKNLIDFRKMGEAAEREEERWDSLVKSIKSASNILVKEAQALANNLVTRGVPIAKTGDYARLDRHYHEQARAFQAKTNGLDAFRRQFPALQAEFLVKNKAWHEADTAAEKAAIAAEMARRETAFKAALSKLGSKTPAQIEAAWQARKNIDAIDVKANSDKNWRPIPGKPPAPGDKLRALENDANRIGRQQTLRIMLQAARDFRILNDLLAQEPEVVSSSLVAQAAGKLAQENPRLVAEPAKKTYAAVAATGPVIEETAKTPAAAGGGGAGAALAAGAALVTLVALGEDGGDDMFFGMNGLGAVKLTKDQKAAAKTAKRETAKATAAKKAELRTAAKARASALLAKKQEAVAAKREIKRTAKLNVLRERAAAKVVAVRQKAEIAEAKRAARLAKVRDQAAKAAAQGATPEAAAASAMAYDAQQYPGEPLVTSPAQVAPMMQASETAEPAASAWPVPVPEQSYEEQPASAEDDPWAIQMPAAGTPVAQPWDELQYDPSVTQAAEAELVDTADEGDVEYQEAAGAVEAEGSLTPYPGEEIPTVTGEEEMQYEIEVVPESRFRARGFFGMGAVAQAKAVAKRAAVKAAARGAKPAEAVAVARRVARRFFARQDYFAVCRRA